MEFGMVRDSERFARLCCHLCARLRGGRTRSVAPARRPSRGWRALIVGGLVSAVSIYASAQQPTFKAGTRLVSVFATVTDAGKRLVPSLMEHDFEIFDNDKPQPLVFFKNEVQPITVIVMLDTSFSMTRSIPLLRSASEQFLIRLLPADKGRVGAFNDKIELSSH